MNKVRDIFGMYEFDTYSDRLSYLMLRSNPGAETFGGLRELNQAFYSSPEWKRVRREVIARDYGCDMGLAEWPIRGRIVVHHMNPVTPETLIHSVGLALDPIYLVCVSEDTHRFIHFSKVVRRVDVERQPGDTRLW